jgi:hypothetical protein
LWAYSRGLIGSEIDFELFAAESSPYLGDDMHAQ